MTLFLWQDMGQVFTQNLMDQLVDIARVGIALGVDVKWLLQSVIQSMATTLFSNAIIVNPNIMKQHVDIRR